MNCPVCGQGLREIERSGINIDVCPGCKGVWLDRGELEKLVEREGAMGSAPSPAAERPVPAYERERQPEYRRHGDDDDWDERREGYGDPRRRKRKGFLGEIFDVFD